MENKTFTVRLWDGIRSQEYFHCQKIEVDADEHGRLVKFVDADGIRHWSTLRYHIVEERGSV